MALSSKKTVSFVGTVGIPANYGGFETLVEQLANQLSDKYNLQVFCSSKNYKKTERDKHWNNTTRIFIPLNANGLQSILYDSICIIKAIKTSDTICLFGASASSILLLLRPFLKKKIVIFHPDGQEWKRRKWNSISSLYLYLSIKAGCIASNYIIVDNKALVPFYKKFESKIVECSYGGDQYRMLRSNSEGNEYWLSIARAEPENNLQLIAETFAQTPSQKWLLISNYKKTKFGKRFYKRFKNQKNITFVSAEYSKEAVERYLSNCKGYIHGHSAGGTNPSLTVAMWLNKPLLCHKNQFNLHTTKNKSLFFSDSKQLSGLIEKSYTKTTQLSIEALKIAKEEYTWQNVSTVYETLFKSTP